MLTKYKEHLLLTPIILFGVVLLFFPPELQELAYMKMATLTAFSLSVVEILNMSKKYSASMSLCNIHVIALSILLYYSKTSTDFIMFIGCLLVTVRFSGITVDEIKQNAKE